MDSERTETCTKRMAKRAVRSHRVPSAPPMCRPRSVALVSSSLLVPKDSRVRALFFWKNKCFVVLPHIA